MKQEESQVGSATKISLPSVPLPFPFHRQDDSSLMGLRWISFRIWTWWVPPVGAFQGGRLSASQRGSLAYLRFQRRPAPPHRSCAGFLAHPRLHENYPTRYSDSQWQMKARRILLSSAGPQLSLRSIQRPFKCHPNNHLAAVLPIYQYSKETIHSPPRSFSRHYSQSPRGRSLTQSLQLNHKHVAQSVTSRSSRLSHFPYE